MKKLILISLILCSVIHAKRKETVTTYLDSLTTTVTTRLNSVASGGLVILPFSDQSGKELGKQCEEYLYQSFINSGKVSVVDRTQIQTVMAEMDLQGMMSPEDQLKVGSLVSARYLLTGSVNKGFNDTWMVSLKVISVETTGIVAGAAVQIPQILFESPKKK